MLTPPRQWLLGGALMAACGTAGCRGDTVEPEVPDTSSAYWALTLDHRAISLSTVTPHNTIQLTAVPRSPSGAALEGLPAPTYVSANTELLAVSATGLVTARAPAFNVPVVARLNAGGITHVDTAYFLVLPEPAPTLASFSIHPLPGDSAKWALTGKLFEPQKVLVPTALDPLGNPLLVPTHFHSLDPTISAIDARSGLLAPVRRGKVTFVATTTAYGITMADTLPFTIGTVLFGVVRVQATPTGDATFFDPSPVTIGTGGFIFWENVTGIPTDVTFEDPAAAEAVPEYFDCFNGMPCDAGNIPAFTANPDLPPDQAEFDRLVNGRRLRRFSTPGTYTYRSTLLNSTGTIVVVAE